MLRTFQDYDDIEGLVICLELVLRELIAQEHLAGLDENEEAAGEDVPWIPQGTIADDNEIQQDQAPPVVYTGSVGRPKFEITREQINFLVESGFTVSNHLQVHTLLTCGCHPYATENEVKVLGTFGD